MQNLWNGHKQWQYLIELTFVLDLKVHAYSKSSTKNENVLNMFSPSGHQRSGCVCFFIRFVEMCLSNGCSAVNGCRQNESRWMLCSEWVPSEWESMDALQWMGAVRMRVDGCSAVNGCCQNESQWMLCSEWVPSEWESMDALQLMGAVRMRVW